MLHLVPFFFSSTRLVYLLSSLFFLAFAKAQSQQAPLKVVTKLVADSFYGVDDFNHIYSSKNNVFYKYQAGARNEKPVQQFYDVQLGELYNVDLINPLKILLFYKDTQTVVLLDNRLNESLRIDLSSLSPYRYFDHAALAGERRLWLFNTDADRVELYDYSLNTLILSTPAIKQDALKMLTDYNFCHIVTPSGIVSYNNYGSKVGQMQQTGITLADLDFDQLVTYSTDDFLSFTFNATKGLEKTEPKWKIDQQDMPQSLYLKNGKLYIYSLNQLSVYTTQ